MSGSEDVRVADVEDRRVAVVDRLERFRRADERPAVERDDALHVRRPELCAAGRGLDEVLLVGDRHGVVEAPLEADRRGSLRAHAGTAE